MKNLFWAVMSLSLTPVAFGALSFKQMEQIYNSAEMPALSDFAENQVWSADTYYSAGGEFSGNILVFAYIDKETYAGAYIDQLSPVGNLLGLAKSVVDLRLIGFAPVLKVDDLERSLRWDKVRTRENFYDRTEINYLRKVKLEGGNFGIVA